VAGVGGANPLAPSAVAGPGERLPFSLWAEIFFWVIVGFFLKDLPTSRRAGMGHLPWQAIASCHAPLHKDNSLIPMIRLVGYGVKNFSDALGTDVPAMLRAHF
jgi:hypothetical protein